MKNEIKLQKTINSNNISAFIIFIYFCFSGPHLQHTEVPRLGFELELQLLAYATAIATPDPSCICNLHQSSQQHCILNPLSEASDQTHNLMVPSQICFHGATTRMPIFLLFKRYVKKHHHAIPYPGSFHISVRTQL